MSGAGGTLGLGARLRAVEVPDEDAARERAALVVSAAFAEERAAAGRQRGARAGLRAPRPLPALAAAVAAIGALLAFTTPGEAVRHWVRDVVDPGGEPRTAKPALERLPAAGSLLVRSPAGVWVVRRDGSKRLLGPYRDATWSPRARFVAAARDTGLLAVEPGGRVHWTLARPGARRARWAPSGFRVAYVHQGRVRVVAGDGTGDRYLRRGVVAAWRPGQRHVLAVAHRDGRVFVEDVDTRQVLWRARVRGPLSLSWSANGELLLVRAPGAVHALRASGEQARLPGAAEAAFAPHGRRVALIRRHRGTSQLLLQSGRRTRLLFAGAGRLAGLTWSPDGRWLAVAWPTADQFLFVRTTGEPRVHATQGVAREFDPRFARGAPTPVGWR